MNEDFPQLLRWRQCRNAIMAHALIISLSPALCTGTGAGGELWAVGSEILALLDQPISLRSCLYISCDLATTPSGSETSEPSRQCLRQWVEKKSWATHLFAFIPADLCQLRVSQFG
jgi:hypothetical protein